MVRNNIINRRRRHTRRPRRMVITVAGREGLPGYHRRIIPIGHFEGCEV